MFSQRAPTSVSASTSTLSRAARCARTSAKRQSSATPTERTAWASSSSSAPGATRACSPRSRPTSANRSRPSSSVVGPTMSTATSTAISRRRSSTSSAGSRRNTTSRSYAFRTSGSRSREPAIRGRESRSTRSRWPSSVRSCRGCARSPLVTVCASTTRFVGLLYTGFMDERSIVRGLAVAPTEGIVELLLHPTADSGRRDRTRISQARARSP